MAYITKPKDYSVTDQNQQSDTLKTPTLTQSGPATLGGSSAVSTKGSGAPTNTGKTASGSFVNLQNYLDTNKPQAAQLGSNVASSMNQQGTDATNALNTAKSSFNTQVSAGTPTVNQGVVDKAIAAPTDFAKAPEATDFTRMLSGTYGGPTVAGATSTWAPASTAVNKATQTAGLVDTAGGQQELLRQIAPTPYSKGGLAMNQMLLQNTDEARNAVTQSAEGLKPLATNLTNTLTEANTAVTDATKTAADTRTNVVNQIAGTGGALSRYQQELDAKTAAQQAEDKKNLDIMQSIINGTYGVTATPTSNSATSGMANPASVKTNEDGPSQASVIAAAASNKNPNGITQSMRDTMARLGMTEEKLNELANQNATIKGYGIQDLRGIQAQNYVPQDPSTYVKSGDVASTEDLARYRALNNLIGNQGKDINLQYGAKTNPYDTAISELNNQLATYRTRKDTLAQVVPQITTDVRTQLQNSGFTSTSSSSGAWQPGEEANWVRSDGKTLAQLIGENQGISNAIIGLVGNLIPGASTLLTVAKLLGWNPAEKLANSMGWDYGIKQPAPGAGSSTQTPGSWNGMTGIPTGDSSTQTPGSWNNYAGVLAPVSNNSGNYDTPNTGFQPTGGSLNTGTWGMSTIQAPAPVNTATLGGVQNASGGSSSSSSSSNSSSSGGSTSQSQYSGSGGWNNSGSTSQSQYSGSGGWNS